MTAQKQELMFPQLSAEQREHLEKLAEAQKPLTQEQLETVIPAPAFDPALPPSSAGNISAAKARGWRYDPRRKAYRDSDGSLVADRFGQRY